MENERGITEFKSSLYEKYPDPQIPDSVMLPGLPWTYGMVRGVLPDIIKNFETKTWERRRHWFIAWQLLLIYGDVYKVAEIMNIYKVGTGKNIQNPKINHESVALYLSKALGTINKKLLEKGLVTEGILDKLNLKVGSSRWQKLFYGYTQERENF